MYVNYYTRELIDEGDNHPIDIVLCIDKSDSVVKYTLSEENIQVFASKFMLYFLQWKFLRKSPLNYAFTLIT